MTVSDKSSFKDKLLLYTMLSLALFVLCFIIGACITLAMGQQEITFSGIFEVIFSGEAFGASIAIFAICFLFVILSVNSKSTKKMKGKDKLENVRFLTPSEVDKTFKHCYFHELHNESITGVPFKAVYKNGRIKIHFTPACHTLIIGATGTGKTVSFIEPAVQILSSLKNKPSMLITDTKGEIYAHHSQKLKDEGYNVVLLDLTRPYNSMQWNPLEPIYDDWQKQLHLE